MDVSVGLSRKLSTEEFMFLNWVLEKTLEGLLDCKEIQLVHSEGDQPWDFFGRNIGGILHNGILVDIKKV